MCIQMYANVCAEEPQNLSNRSSPTAIQILGKGRGEEDQFVFIGPLFLFSVLRRPPLRTPFRSQRFVHCEAASRKAR